MFWTSSALIDDRLQRTGFLPEENALLKLACAQAFRLCPQSDARARVAAVEEVIQICDARPDIAFADMLLNAKRALMRHELARTVRAGKTRPQRSDGSQRAQGAAGALAA